MSTYNWVGYIDYLNTPEYNYGLYFIKSRGLGGLATAHLSVYVNNVFDNSNAGIASQAP